MSAGEAPAPAPGQRWRDTWGHYEYVDVIRACGAHGFDIEPGGAIARCAFTDRLVYLAPTPGYVPSPATPTPAAAPPTVAGVGGPPKGYAVCTTQGCATWTYGGDCWACYLARAPEARENVARLMAKWPDWTPTAAPLTREQILAEELRANGPLADTWAAYDSGPTVQASPEALEAQIEVIKRVRAHQLAEGGPSATAKAPGKAAPPPFVPSVDEWDLLPDADAAPVRYRRPAPCTCCGGVEYGSRVCPLCGDGEP